MKLTEQDAELAAKEFECLYPSFIKGFMAAADKYNDLYELCKQQHEVLMRCDNLLQIALTYEGGLTGEKVKQAIEQYNKLFE